MSGQRGRGAERRREKRAQRERNERLAWWTQPGVIIFGIALALAIGGWVLIVRESRRVPVQKAEIDGIQLELIQARWLLDQMDHGENFQKPSVMMPDMPERGKQRVTLELALSNQSSEARRFDGHEFFLVPRNGEPVPPMGANVGFAELGPGQSFNTALYFDFDTNQPYGRLAVEWRRDGETVYLPIPEPAEHYHLRPRSEEALLPPDARLLLPLGKADRGASLFAGVYGCVACHGDPEIPESNNIGPHLADIGATAGSRAEGVLGEQYIYESILDPGAFIAPECERGRPCTEPSAMPEYASLINLQDAADLLAFLLEQKG